MLFLCYATYRFINQMKEATHLNTITHWVKEHVSGIVSCVALAFIAQIIGKLFPQIGAALFAIFLGIILGNTVLNHPSFNKGVKFSESRLLEYSICLTGLTLNIRDVLSVRANGILFIALQMTATIFFAYLIGKKMRFHRKFALLMCAGNAVCGSSAIGSVAPILEADEKDKGISITIVNLTGTVLMITLPILTSFFYHHEVIPTSAMIGGTLQSIGQVIASAKLVSDGVVQYATIFKIIRIIFLVVVAFAFSKMNTQNHGRLFDKKCIKHSSQTTKKTKIGIPWFILVFFACCLFVTFIKVPHFLPLTAKTISNQFEIIALAGIGMRVKFADLIKEGPKAMMYGLSIGFSQIIIALLLIALFF